MLFPKFLQECCEKRTAKNLQKEREEISRKSYSRLLDTVGIFTGDEERTKEDKLLLLDYLIQTILADVCADAVFKPLVSWPEQTLSDPFPSKYYDKTGQEHPIMQGEVIPVDLETSIVYVQPWSKEKAVSKLLFLKNHDFVFDRNNHYSKYYANINLCYVYNGNHSINAGRYYRKGTIMSPVYDLESLYPHCTTDGIYWYNKHTGSRISEVADFRLAAVFSIAQLRWTIRNAES